jgi:hypothetical protein
MAYVYEKISPEDYIKFNIEAIHKKHRTPNIKNWIFDKDKNIFLIRLDPIRDELGSLAFIFFFKDQVMRFCLHATNFSKNEDGSENLTWNLSFGAPLKFDYTANLLNISSEDIFKELRAALQLYQIANPGDYEPKCHFSFAF